MERNAGEGEGAVSKATIMTAKIRIVVRGAPVGVAFAVQSGRDGLVAPAKATNSSLTFEVPVDLRADKDGMAALKSAAIQGAGADRFIYVNSGQRAGDRSSCWDRRAKVMLSDVDAKALKQFLNGGGTLAAEIDGKAGDGGPCCARVPAVWRLV